MNALFRSQWGRCSHALRSSLQPFVPLDQPDAPRTSHLHNTAVQLWILLLIALTVKLACWPDRHTNYTHYEFGARQWMEGLNMYERGDDGIDFRYGPIFAVLLSPLASLPIRVGGVLFAWINTLAFLAAIRALMRYLLPGRWTPARQGAFLILLLITTFRMLWSVQVNAMVFALAVWSAVALLQQRWWLASILLALAVHFKVWPIAAALLLIGCWPRQLSWRFALSLAGWGLVPFLCQAPSVVRMEYVEWFRALTGRMLLQRHIYRDAWTIWEFFQPTVPHDVYAGVQLGAGLAVLLLCLWQTKRAPSLAHHLTFVLAMWASWQLVFGPATERNTFGLIGPLTAWGLVTAWTHRHGLRWMLTVMFCTVVLGNGTVERALDDMFPWVAAAHPLGVALFAGWLVGFARVWNRHTDQPSQSAQTTAAVTPAAAD